MPPGSRHSPRAHPVSFDDGGRVSIDGADVTTKIRAQKIDSSVPVVARHPAVREVMRSRQRELAGQATP